MCIYTTIVCMFEGFWKFSHIEEGTTKAASVDSGVSSLDKPNWHISSINTPTFVSGSFSSRLNNVEIELVDAEYTCTMRLKWSEPCVAACGWKYYHRKFRDQYYQKCHEIDPKHFYVIMRIVCTQKKQHDRHSCEEFFRRCILCSIVHLLPHV